MPYFRMITMKGTERSHKFVLIDKLLPKPSIQTMLEHFSHQNPLSNSVALDASGEPADIKTDLDFSIILREAYGFDTVPEPPVSDDAILVACNEEAQGEPLPDDAKDYRFNLANGSFHEDADTRRFDTYKSLDELKASLKPGVDYEITVEDRKSKVTIVSPHGGFIEPGSSELAGAIAGDQYNLFDFRGLDAANPYRAHVTSTRFRDPSLTDLLDRSDICVSIHGMRGNNKAVFVGGRNEVLKELVAGKLKAAGFSVNAEPPRFRGTNTRNFVNQPSAQGVQLELSWGLRKQLMDSTNSNSGKHNSKLKTFRDCVRNAIGEYCNRTAK